MAYQLQFAQLVEYDLGAPGISLVVTLKPTGRNVTCAAKIDTGADHCIFARRFGEDLGFDIEAGFRQRFGTATGAFYAYGHEVTLSTAGMEFDAMVFFAEEESFQRNVLGRFGWLDRVVLGLVDYEGKLYLSRHEE